MKEDNALDELDTNRAHEIVTEVFQRKGLTPPYSVEFEYRESADSKPRAYLEDNTLHVTAATEPELKRLVGRFAISSTWSPHDWALLNRPGVYALGALVILITAPAIGYLLANVLLEYRDWIVIMTLTFIIVYSVWAANQITRRSIRLLSNFTIGMADLGCMTEYDSKDYRGDPHLVAFGGTIICIFGLLVSIALGTIFYTQETLFLAPSFILLLLAAFYFLIVPAGMSIKSDLCSQSDEADEQREKTADDVFEDNQYLQVAFRDLIERMDLGSSISSNRHAEFNEVRARFWETKYAQCRGVYDYIEDGTFFIDIRDLSVNAARRYGTAVLATRSIPFYTELSLKRRAIEFFAFLFGLFMLIVALVGAIAVSVEFGIGVLLFTAVVFTWMWRVGAKQNEQARRDIPVALRRTDVFKEYEVGLYSDMMFSMSARFDLSLLIGFLASFLILGILVLVLL
jgi:hypothetical protein